MTKPETLHASRLEIERAESVLTSSGQIMKDLLDEVVKRNLQSPISPKKTNESGWIYTSQEIPAIIAHSSDEETVIDKVSIAISDSKGKTQEEFKIQRVKPDLITFIFSVFELKAEEPQKLKKKVTLEQYNGRYEIIPSIDLVEKAVEEFSEVKDVILEWLAGNQQIINKTVMLNDLKK